jgi:hypothetical protein
MKKNKNIDVKGISITVNKRGTDEFICITDIAKYKNPNAPRDIIKNWMRNKNTVCLHIAQGLIHDCVFVSLAGWQICKNLFRFGSFRLCASCDSLKLGLAYGHKEQYTNHKHCK